MKSINLLSLGGEPEGCVRHSGGFEVTEPWGGYRLPDIEISEGWYIFEAKSNAAGVHLELYETNEYRLIELQAATLAPAYVRLSGGRYRPSIMVGARPGTYSVDLAVLRPLSPLGRASLLGKRLFQALKSGMSMRRLVQLAGMAFSKGRTYGIRSHPAAGDDLGILSRYDQRCDWSHLNAEERLKRLNNGPRFLIRAGDNAHMEARDFADQIYRNFTLNPDHAHDVVVTVSQNERLTPDALLLFAEHLQRYPASKVVLADSWIANRPTARIAWDPLLYGEVVPTPFAMASNITADAVIDRSAYGVVSVPVAHADARGKDVKSVSCPSGVAGEKPCTIIIPTRDRADLLEACLTGLFENTTWPHEVVIVDNGSVEPATFAVFDKYASQGLRVVRANIPFNFSTLCNLGAAQAKHDYLLFLNNDVVLHQPDWLSEMMRYAVREDAGAVGARLLYADGRLQHGGVMLGLTQVCGHLWRGLPRQDQDLEIRLRQTSLRSAVTAACLCVAKAKFNAVGGFDAVCFPVTLNDIDLCLKLNAQGWRSIYAADAQAYHLEGESRGEDSDPEKRARRNAELKAFVQAWGEEVTSDPWFPPVFSRASEAVRYR